jgi:hypothetical protein
MAPEAEPTAPGDPDVTVGSRESTLADGAADKRQVGPTSVDETQVSRGTGQHCEGHSEPHGRRRVPQGTRPGRDNSPSREPGTCAEGKAATNDPRGRRLHDHSTQSHGDARRQKTARASSSTAMPTWASAAWRIEPTPQRDGPEAGRLRDGTARPANAEGTRTAKPHERWPSDRSAARAAGGNATGPVDDGGPAGAPPSAPNPSAVNATRIEEPGKREPKRARTLRRAPQRKTDADGRPGREGRKRPKRQPGRVAGKPIRPR